MDKTDFSYLLYKAMVSVKNEEECASLFADICTPKEIQSMAQRLFVAKLLSDGRVYTDIIKETGASTATISRVRRTMTDGSKKVFERIKDDV